jgi:histidinol phosphatase-like PHP family hydrolase
MSKFKIDHDLHIHSQLSSCSSDSEQTTEAILADARMNGLRTICLTDHFWDASVPGASEWYKPQDFAHISQALPLHQTPDCRFLFGCEGDMDRNFTVGIAPETFPKFDFVIIPTTHLHMRGFTISEEDAAQPARRAELCVARLQALLERPYPFSKIGIAHPTCSLLAGGGGGQYPLQYLDILDLIPDETWGRLFAQVAQVGMGVELNMPMQALRNDDERRRMFRPYRIARECGCTFYLGSDAHHPADLTVAIERFKAMVDGLELEEKDKFPLVR